MGWYQRRVHGGADEGSHEEKEGSQHGPHQVRGEVQVRQEQVVFPEAEVLDLSKYLYCCELFLLSTKQVSWQPVFGKLDSRHDQGNKLLWKEAQQDPHRVPQVW